MRHWQVLIFLVGIYFSLACINTSYSRDDEVEVTSEIGHLIVGAFAHHGDDFYRAEIERTQAVLLKSPEDFVARNDLASAYTKLSLWHKAEEEFMKNETLHPGKYETASNLGVLYKKKGDYEKAAEYIRKALAIKPEGHMGLGDYYLRMIEWKQKKLAEEVRVKKEGGSEGMNENFLGIPYDLPPAELIKNPIVKKEYLITLIKNDYQFLDVYRVLGDVLFAEGNMQMALRAYAKVNEQRRMHQVLDYWKKNRKEDYIVEPYIYLVSQSRLEFSQAGEWLKSFQKVESDLLKQGKSVDFKLTLKECELRGVGKPKLIELGYYEGSEDWQFEDYMITLVVFVILLYIILKIKSTSKNKRRQA